MRWISSIGVLIAAMVVSGVTASLYSAQADSQPAIAPPPRIGFVSIHEIMKNSRIWRQKAAMMQKRRSEESEKITKLQNEILILKGKLPLATAEDRNATSQEMKVKEKAMEAATKAAKEEIDRFSLDILIEFKDEIHSELMAMCRERNLNVVFTYSFNEAHGVKPEELKTSQFMDYYFHPTAAVPIYIADNYDLTSELIERFDAKHSAELKKAKVDEDQ